MNGEVENAPMLGAEEVNVSQAGGGAATIQRKWSDADAGSYPAPADKTQLPTPAGGWNAGPQTIGGVERIPLEGLKEGLQKDANKDAGTKEGDTGKAIAVVPAALKPGAPVEILLHLHGHNVGYRERSQAVNAKSTAKDDLPLPQGSVRDVSADQIEQQMDAAGRNMIGILPQGTLGSGFGDFWRRKRLN